jgi:HD-like signal output (HDOD) protein
MSNQKLILQSIASFLRRTWLLPQSILAAIKHRRLQVASGVAEAERLDRIRNPSDYLGK